uniref:Uncharacterized protein n=1 Tax=Amphimedon queenslandica TaxID=400682 RepID=A0A1X7V5B5_AMPQE
MEFSEELRWLASKAYPDLSAGAQEQLALTHLLSSIDDTQTVLLVKQKNPSSLAEAITYIMQIESVLAPTCISATNTEAATFP